MSAVLTLSHFDICFVSVAESEGSDGSDPVAPCSPPATVSPLKGQEHQSSSVIKREWEPESSSGDWSPGRKEGKRDDSDIGGPCSLKATVAPRRDPKPPPSSVMGRKRKRKREPEGDSGSDDWSPGHKEGSSSNSDGET